MKSLKAAEAAEAIRCSWFLRCVEDYCAQGHYVAQAERLLHFARANEAVAVVRVGSYRWRPAGDHWVVNMEDSSEQEAVVHIHETQAVEVRWVDRTYMGVTVPGHSVAVAAEPHGQAGRSDVSWLVALETGMQMARAATSKLSHRLCLSALFHPAADLSSFVSICDEEQTLLHLWLGRLGRKHCLEAPSSNGLARLC
jgi:hypothetical protein